MKNYLEIALDYHDSGLAVIPWELWEDGSARFKSGWKKYQFGQTKEEVKSEFSKPCHGIALICTNGIEVIDIDVKNDPKKTIAKDFFEDVAFTYGSEALLSKCTIVKTKSKGWHVIYKTGITMGNTKLASRLGEKEATIETRGKGGLVFIAPTPGYSIRHGDYKKLPILTDDERNLLIDIAKAQNEQPEVEREVLPKVEHPVSKKDNNLTPWEDYDQQHHVLDLLLQAGWKDNSRAGSGKVYLSKPNASKARDTHGAILTAKNGASIFWPFTTATEFEPERGYGPFGVYAYLNHRGDFKAAAKALFERGYGTQPEKKEPEEIKAEEGKKKEVSGLLARVKSTKFDVTQPIREEAASLTLNIDGKIYKVGAPGMMGVITGEQKSGKSLVTSCIAASGLGRKSILNFDFNLEKGMEYFDTEQSRYFYQLTQKRLYDLAGLKRNHPKYSAFLLRRESIEDRVAAIDEMLKDRKDLSCIIIDGAVDLCRNFNDEKASIEIADKLLQWSDKTGALLITVLHTTKAMGFLRGHLGTALQNKADFVIQAKQDKQQGVYTVECRESRFAPFPSFHFTRDGNGFPVLDGEESKPYEYEKEIVPNGIPLVSARRDNVDDSVFF